MDTLGDFEESSRAVPTDIDVDNAHIRLISEITEDGKTWKNSLDSAVYTLCCFNGAASQSLAEAYVAKMGDEATALSKAFLVIDGDAESEEPSTSKNKQNQHQSKRLILSVFKVRNVLLAVTYQDQFGSSFCYELLDSVVRPWTEHSRVVYIFHADSNSNFKSSLSNNSLYYLKSNAYEMQELSDLKKSTGVKQLPMPNLIEHFSAALLNHCEMVSKPCLCLVIYTEFSDTLSHLPFLRFVQSCLDLQDLPRLSSDIGLRTKTNNSILYNSNLFI